MFSVSKREGNNYLCIKGIQFAIYICKGMFYPGVDPGFLEREFICIKMSGGGGGALC